ncbi:hypothetical protein [Bosea massiliensis]|uniref:Uncharacterized protein n=1 Tax=Bosea massiliensis TaxID=151419 RepID=A0ABW0NWY4_9HYPH
MSGFTGAGFYRVRTETGTSVLWCAQVRTPSGKGAQMIAGWRSQQASRDLKAAMLMLPQHQFDAVCISAISPLAGG